MAIGLILTSLMGSDDSDEYPAKSGWDLWLEAERFVKIGWEGKVEVPYSAFKSALGDLASQQVLAVVGSLKGRSKNSAAARIYQFTEAGVEWMTMEGSKYINHPSVGQVIDRVGNPIPDKVIPLLRRLAKTGKPLAISHGNPEVWKAWRWLRQNGYTRSLIQITDDGRKFLVDAEGNVSS